MMSHFTCAHDPDGACGAGLYHTKIGAHGTYQLYRSEAEALYVNIGVALGHARAEQAIGQVVMYPNYSTVIRWREGVTPPAGTLLFDHSNPFRQQGPQAGAVPADALADTVLRGVCELDYSNVEWNAEDMLSVTTGDLKLIVSRSAAALSHQPAQEQAAPDCDIRGPLTDVQRTKCRDMYNNIKNPLSGGYQTADDVIRVIRKAAEYGYMNARHDLAAQQEPVATPQQAAAPARRLSEANVWEIAQRHSNGSAVGEYCHFNGEGLDAFAIELMDSQRPGVIDYSIKKGDTVYNKTWRLTSLEVVDVNWALSAIAVRLGPDGDIVVWPAAGFSKTPYDERAAQLDGGRSGGQQ